METVARLALRVSGIFALVMALLGLIGLCGGWVDMADECLRGAFCGLVVQFSVLTLALWTD